MKNLIIITMLMLLCAAGCKKEKIAEIDKLPAATQTGVNTFGCLVNGKAWVAQTDCKFLCDAPLKLYYDANGGGNVFVSALSESIKERMSFAIDSTNTKVDFDYAILGSSHMGFTYSDEKLTSNCRFLFSTDSTTSTSGNVTLTRYDLQNGIISGTFNFTLIKASFSTIRITDGRFDKKL